MSPRAQAAWAGLAVLPFLAPYVHHATAGPGVPTGFILYDMAYYCANGRAVFERGNGLAYPNPYDPNPAAPVIYFHWLIWLLGVGVVKLGADPGLLLFGLGLVGAFACSWLTLRLVLAVLPGTEYCGLLFLLTMWSGGALCLGGALVSALAHRAPADNLFLFDPVDGWWFLNWGRNLILPTESVYHALMAAAWLAVLRRHCWWALVPAALLAATHPFSGLQLLLILVAWYAIVAAREATPQAVARWLAASALLALLLLYYLVFLERFGQHKALRREWSLEWTLTRTTIVLGYGPVAALAFVRLARQRLEPRRNTAFLATCFTVSFLLANHEWLLPPVQPLHFTRGYVWMPLWLLGMPLVQRGLVRARQALRPLLFATAVALGGTLACLDNALFLITNCRTEPLGLYLSRDEKDALRWIDGHHCQGVLLCPNPDLSYLAATYTSLRPYVGHLHNTPNFAERGQRVWTWAEGGAWDPAWGEIDYVLVEKQRAVALPGPGPWLRAYDNDRFVLWRAER
jgi:hypothetical protein